MIVEVKSRFVTFKKSKQFLENVANDFVDTRAHLSYGHETCKRSFFRAGAVLLLPKETGKESGDNHVGGANGEARHQSRVATNDMGTGKDRLQAQQKHHEQGRNGGELESPTIGGGEEHENVENENRAIGSLGRDGDGGWPKHVRHMDCYEKGGSVAGSHRNGGENGAAVNDVEGRDCDGVREAAAARGGTEEDDNQKRAGEHKPSRGENSLD